MSSKIRSGLLFGLWISLCSVSLGWQTEPASAWKPGLDQITEGKVTATISFLASDELAGRATGSTEFNIAASYVASRLRGAGCVGGASDGSFYHETMTRMIQTPSVPVVFHDDQNHPIAQHGLLAAGPEGVEFKGPITQVDLSADLPTGGLVGAVGCKMKFEARGTRALAQVAKLASNLKAAGASAMLLGFDGTNELLEFAQAGMSKPKLDSPRNRFEIPVLMVPLASLDTQSIQLSIPAITVQQVAMRNVIGVLQGTDPEASKEGVLFSAHLDHLGTSVSVGDGIFNGADDDASGVTAVVTLADAFAAMPRQKRSLIFMTFWGEESGLLGSKQFVTTPSWPLDKIVANVNIEMIGRPEAGARGKIWMTGWKESDLGVLMNQAASRLGVEIFDHPTLSGRLYRQSDNWSFAEKGVIAHSFSAGSLHPDYHGPDDEWDRLEIPHMTRVIQGLFVGSLPLAEGSSTPTRSSTN